MKKIMKDIPSFPRKIAKAIKKKTTRSRRNMARDTGGDLHQTQDTQEDLQHGLRDHPVKIYRFPGDLHSYPGDLRHLEDMICYAEDSYCYPRDLNCSSSNSDIINIIVDLWTPFIMHMYHSP